MPLSEQYRSKLDTIVGQMEANGESPENIRFVVNDFKQKYGEYEQNIATQKETQEINRLRAEAQTMERERPQRMDEARRESFQNLPMTERALAGAGAVAYSTPGLKQFYDATANVP